MIDSFPFDEWSEDIAAFWTWGPGGSSGTYTLTVLGMILMVAAFIGFVWLENRKVTQQAATLRATGIPLPGAGPGPGAAQPPLGGPTTEPGR